MASLVVAGDVSGSVTLSAPSAAGSTVITLPTTSGTMVVTGGAQTVQFAAGSAAAPSITFTGDTNTGIFSPAADTIAFSEGGVESMRIDSSGNLNMSTVGGKVNFATTSSATVNYIGVPADGFSLELACQRGASQPFVYKLDFANGHIWSTAGSERMRIASDGIIAMGTTDTSNTTRLKVQSGSTTNRATSAQLSVQRNSSSTQYEGICFVSGVAQSAYILRVPNSDDLTFGFDAGGSTTERMRITSDGNLLAGTTNTNSLSSEGFRYFGGSGNQYGGFTRTSAAPFFLCRMSSDGQIQQFFRDGTQVGSISVTTSNTSYVTTSDYRLKESIAPMQNALNVVQQLKPVTYTWKSDGSAGQGFIAHELQAVVPDCVVGEKDAVDEEGKPIYQGIDTSFLVATLTAAIQELNAKVVALEEKLNAK